MYYSLIFVDIDAVNMLILTFLFWDLTVLLSMQSPKPISKKNIQCKNNNPPFFALRTHNPFILWLHSHTLLETSLQQILLLSFRKIVTVK